MSDWYNREYERHIGFTSEPIKESRVLKMREHFDQKPQQPEEDEMNPEEIVTELENILQNLEKYGKKIKELEKTLLDMNEFLKGLTNENA